jgi:hypothetical protein
LGVFWGGGGGGGLVAHDNTCRERAAKIVA